MDVGGSEFVLPQQENTEAEVREGCEIVKNTQDLPGFPMAMMSVLIL